MKNLQTLAIILTSFLSIESCISDDMFNTKSVSINETFTLEFQQEANLTLESFQIKIIDVIEDSRCPMNDRANCFWNGQVRTEVEITIEGQMVNKELMFRFGKNTPLIYGEYIIELESVIPENQIDEMIELKDYIFEIKISKSENQY